MIKSVFRVEDNHDSDLKERMLRYTKLNNKLTIMFNPIDIKQTTWQFIDPIENRSIFLGYIIGVDLTSSEVEFISDLKGVEFIKQV
jgi:hypothetical protein